MKIRLVGVELFHADGQTNGQADRHNKGKSRFFASLRKAPRKATSIQKFFCFNAAVGTSHQKTYVRFIFACDINLPLKYFCATINISVLFKVACSSVKHTECTITFSLPQELHIAPQSYNFLHKYRETRDCQYEKAIL